MNWELQLSAALRPGEADLLGAAKQARELVERGRYGSALQVLWKLLLPASRGKSPRRRAFLMLHMGHIYRRWMIEVAFKLFRDARELARRTDFARGEMVAEASLGLLYLDWNAPERALPHFERCLELAESCAGAWWRRDVLVEVVGCLTSLGRTEAARESRERIERLDAEILRDLWGGDEDGSGAASPPREREEADHAGSDR